MNTIKCCELASPISNGASSIICSADAAAAAFMLAKRAGTFARTVLWRLPSRTVPVKCLDGHVHLEDTYPLEMYYKLTAMQKWKLLKQN